MFMVIVFISQVVFPTAALALTGGPSQPEVQSFEPVGTSEMVDLFSGDFNYNIPLMDVDGYPVNISYHSGVTMDQEASWVGLGWNINPGVINRTMRGLPDDFNGDQVTKEYNMKPNETFGLDYGGSVELFGNEILKIGAQFSIGIKYNNYTGINAQQNLTLSLSAGAEGKTPLSASLGITSSSDDGLTIQPSVGISTRIAKTDAGSVNLGLHLGTTYNSRQGLKALTISVSPSTNIRYGTCNRNFANNMSQYSLKGPSATFDFGMPTYTPQVNMSMTNFSVAGHFNLGLSLIGLFPSEMFAGYYSNQRLAQTSVTSRAYGYYNADEGANYDDVLMDFNREHDSPFNASTPALPLTNFTFDMLSVSGQGVGGSYRPFRSDLGYVFDNHNSTSSNGLQLAVELGWAPDFIHFGIDLGQTTVVSESGKWTSDNDAITNLNYKSQTNNPSYEKFYFKEANEKSVDSDPAFLTNAGGLAAERIDLKSGGAFFVKASSKYKSGKSVSPTNYRSSRDKRNQAISYLTRGEIDNKLGLDSTTTMNLSTGAQSYHLGEITSLGTDGRRYVYGIAAYNQLQEETTFAVGSTSIITEANPPSPPSCGTTGLVPYSSGDNSLGNTKGVDNYFSNIKMPPYAHAYMLTAVLSTDYVDSDIKKGPSEGDYGSWTKFYYKKVDNYKWRVPAEENKANYNEGMKNTFTDDKASYIYGEKELWYLDKVETKNYIATFSTAPREDGLGVKGRDGGIDGTDTTNAQRYLKQISLYTKPNYKAHLQNTSIPLVPIKQVFFDYDYSLCPGVPNNKTSGKGKLTLKGIYFSYQGSFKARLSPYQFHYNSLNPGYDITAYDRWGNYKPNNCGGLNNSEYPYINQNSQTDADQNTSAWSLTDIILPSGGTINVKYESDDYGYVQDKAVMQMCLVDHTIDPTTGNPNNQTLDNNGRLVFDLPLDPITHVPISTHIQDYISGISNLYFRFLMNLNDPTDNEYVSGYAQIDAPNCTTTVTQGIIALKGVNLGGASVGNGFSPITKAGIQFGRINCPHKIWLQPSPAIQGNTITGAILQALYSTSFFTNIKDAILGPDFAIYNKGKGRNFIQNKAWIRLNMPKRKKFGGGARVKTIQINDDWGALTSDANQPNFNYGQEYTYTLADGSSSGVATYEPQIGGDENPWKQPVFYQDPALLLIPSDEHYVEEPFGECFFPSPSVGYSKVIVKNLQRTNLHHNATGMVVHEFYTARDFPTITDRTDLQEIRDKTDPLTLSSLFQIDVKDYMTASQGFMVELNDMHGKPRSQSVYQESQTTPITSVEYRYKQNMGNSSQLDNSVTVINKNGSIGGATIGQFFDYTSDFRESKTLTNGWSGMGNLDIWDEPIPGLFGIILPNFNNEEVKFRSASVTKVVQRFGLLEETIAKDLGSVVSTKNLAYDAETGEVLLTKTTNDFNDPVYNLTFPAHWYYSGMAAAYQNISTVFSGLSFNGGSANFANAGSYFEPGDEIELIGTTQVAWVTATTANSLTAVLKDGTPVGYSGNVKVLRSGHRNQQVTPMATLTSLTNPMGSIQYNSYQNVLQASAVEFSDIWKTFCDCIGINDVPATTNPYIEGIRGNWRNKRSNLHLTSRTLSNYDNNTNIRKDGVFTAFSPFYAFNGGKWVIDNHNWTFTSEVTEFSIYGPELENVDALGRYSSAEFRYNQSLAAAVAANAGYRDMGFDNFEDYEFSKCADNHFKFNQSQTPTIDKTQAHTGKRSVSVGITPVIMERQLVNCNAQPAPCSLTFCSKFILLTAAFSTVYKIDVLGGTAPYMFTWNIIAGNITSVTLTSGGYLSVVFPPNPITSIVQVDVTDASGCTLSRAIRFNINGGNMISIDNTVVCP